MPVQMSLDLTRILQDWPYEPGQINVRLVEGDDGRPKIQMRLDLGLLQMEVSGRPDGQRPHGFDSLLEYYETVLEEGQAGPAHGESAEGPFAEDARASGAEAGDEAAAQGEGEDSEDSPVGPDSGTGGMDGFVLTAEDCRLLRDEAVQYYHRYISLLVLGDYQGVVRDTTRNLRVLDLCRDYAEDEDDRQVLEQFRPYITMMRTRAVASQAVVDEEPRAALLAIEDGLEQIRKQFDEQGRGEEFENSMEVQLLRGMRAELSKKLPASQRSELLQRLQDALSRENYELAAILRDELKNLKE